VLLLAAVGAFVSSSAASAGTLCLDKVGAFVACTSLPAGAGSPFGVVPATRGSVARSVPHLRTVFDNPAARVAGVIVGVGIALVIVSALFGSRKLLVARMTERRTKKATVHVGLRRVDAETAQ
jgi:hypothetical protein